MIYIVISTLLIAVCCTAAGLGAMHMLQANRYRIPELRKQLRRYGNQTLVPNVLVAAVAAVLNWYMPILLALVIQKEALRRSVCAWLVLVLFMAAGAFLGFAKLHIPQERSFGFTRRIFRLTMLVFAMNLIGTVLLSVLGLSPYFMFAAADYAVLVGALVMRPVEDKINAGFYKSARAKLAARPDLICIGVTGSYGKTDVKMMLKTLLSEKYRVLSTPPSFSTAMGVCRVVNEQLKDKHQVFIAEMGAQQKGEIKEIAKLVMPRYGVLTCVGNAHLDSFGSLEAAAQTKYELIQSLPEDGAAFFGSDAGFGDRLYKMCKREKYRACIGTEVSCFMHADFIETGMKGTRFELVCADGEKIGVHTALLGSYHVRNIVLAATVARKLGLSMEQIAAGIAKLKPTRHRMQLVPGEITVIDNSLNNLPEAAAEALRVLKSFPGTRILITTGLPGEEEDAADKNFGFGIQISDCADFVILVDPENTKPVMDGMMSKGYPKACVRMVREISDAMDLLKEVAKAGDVVLYEGIYPEEDDGEEE